VNGQEAHTHSPIKSWFFSLEIMMCSWGFAVFHSNRRLDQAIRTGLPFVRASMAFQE